MEWRDGKNNLQRKYQEIFCNRNKNECQIAKRRLILVGRIIRMPRSKIPVRLISSFCRRARPLRKTKCTTRHWILNNISKIIPSVDKNNSFNSWAYIAYDELTWVLLINNLRLDSFTTTSEWNSEFSSSPVNDPSPWYPPQSFPNSPPQSHFRHNHPHYLLL